MQSASIAAIERSLALPSGNRAVNDSQNSGTQRAGQITVKQAALLLLCTEQWIYDLGKRGAIPRPVDGMLPLVETIQGCVRWIKDEQRRSSKSASASRVQEARAREIEIRNHQLENRLVEIADVEAVNSEILGTFRNELAGVPAAATRDLALRRKIEASLNAALDRCRRSLEAACEAYRAGRASSLDAEDTGS